MLHQWGSARCACTSAHIVSTVDVSSAFGGQNLQTGFWQSAPHDSYLCYYSYFNVIWHCEKRWQDDTQFKSPYQWVVSHCRIHCWPWSLKAISISLRQRRGRIKAVGNELLRSCRLHRLLLDSCLDLQYNPFWRSVECICMIDYPKASFFDQAIASRRRSSGSSAASMPNKLRKRMDLLRTESDMGRHSCRCLDRVTKGLNECFAQIQELLEWVRNLEEPPRKSCLGQTIRHKVFDAVIMIAVLANTIFIAHEANYEMTTLGQERLESDFAVEIFFLGLFSVEMFLRLYVHQLYFFVNDDWSWNIMDTILVLLAYVDQILEHLDATVGKVGVLRVLRVARLFRIIRVLRFLKEVRVMLVAILGSFLSLFWALLMMAVIIFIFAVYFMQRMTSHLSNTSDELWSLQKEYFRSTQQSMFVLLMASTGGKDWEEVQLAKISMDLPLNVFWWLDLLP